MESGPDSTVQRNFYRATAAGLGGVHVIWLTGTAVDWEVLVDSMRPAPVPTRVVSAQWTRMLDAAETCLDEVMLHFVRPELAMLTTHGGTATAHAIQQRLAALGWTACDAWPGAFPWTGAETTLLACEADRLLPTCRTEAQAALVLAAREALPGLLDEATPPTLLDRYERARDLLRPRTLCLVGAANVGKSSLLNCLAGADRALVHPLPGTTLDPVDVWVDLGGYAVRLVDTPGLRVAAGVLETAAYERLDRELGGADVVVWVLDGSRPLKEDDRALAARLGDRLCLVVINKCDLPRRVDMRGIDALTGTAERVELSCVAGDAAAGFAPMAVQALGGGWDGQPAPVTPRQAAVLARCAQASPDARAALRDEWLYGPPGETNGEETE